MFHFVPAKSDRTVVLRRAALRLAVAGFALAIGGCATTSGGGSARTSSAMPAGDFDYVGWDSYLGGGESSQYSALDQINKSNVKQLQVAWTFKTGAGSPPRFNPIVVGEVMYVLAGDNTIAALNAATGQELWRKQYEGRIGARGINYWQSEDGKDRRLLILNNGVLRAVSAENGEIIQSFGAGSGGVDLRAGLDGDTSKLRPLQTDNPGRVFENLIIMSLPAGAYDFASSAGDIHAYDVRTGELVWKFHVVPKVGEFGSDTWPEKDREKFGGVHNWSESTIDEELGMVYIPTGTARYDFYGGNRPGDNLFGNSILALDARTGKRVWHFQTVHHDIWDFDLPAAPKLMTITKDGKKIPVLIQPSKQGYLYVFDRRDGKPVWPIEEKPVPASDVPGEVISPTQPIPTWPKPYTRMHFTAEDINPYLPEADQQKLREMFKTVRNDGPFTPPSLRGSISMPGHNGGANWGNVAIDPATQRLYVVARELPLLIKLEINEKQRAAQKAAMPNASEGVEPYYSPVNFLLQSNGMVAIKPPFSTLTAYDMNSGNMLWQIPNGEIMTLSEKGITGVGAQASRGGPVATAGGLLFVGTATDRKFRARDAQTGDILWEADLPAATEGVPAVYQIAGRQYVTIPVGGFGHFANGLGLPKPGDNQYITFALPAGAQAGGGQ